MFAFLRRDEHTMLLQAHQGLFTVSMKYILKRIHVKIKGLNHAPHEVHVHCGLPGRKDGLKMIRSVSCLNAGGQLARNEAHWPNIQHPAKKSVIFQCESSYELIMINNYREKLHFKTD